MTLAMGAEYLARDHMFTVAPASAANKANQPLMAVGIPAVNLTPPNSAYSPPTVRDISSSVLERWTFLDGPTENAPVCEL
jgi:hypothetical protein